jgi:acetylornithine deacetylase/succinyl-diaminopimelate desuccinylase-like protein
MTTSIAENAVRFLQDLIRLDTTNPPGNEMIAAEYLAKVLKESDIEPVMIETAPKRGNVIARIKGNGNAPPLLLYSHTDVVPVEREKWTVDPFGGVVKDGYVWGRGALDMKGITAMQLAVFLEIGAGLSRGARLLNRDLIFAATADEETETNQGIGILVEKHPDLLRAEFALSEFGGATTYIGGKAFYPVQSAEKGTAWMRMIARGKPGHASVPSSDNAIAYLARAIEKLATTRLPMHRTRTAHALMNGISEGLGGASGALLSQWMDDPSLQAVDMKRVLGDDMLASELHAITHNTAVPTVLRAGKSTNVIPSQAEATLDCRTLPGFDEEDMIEELRAALGSEILRHIDFQIDSASAPCEFDIDTPMFKLIKAKLKQHDPAAIPVPNMLTGATDAKHMAKLGAICYGFSPMKLEAGENFFDLVHGHDERVSVNALSWGANVLFDVVSAWCYGSTQWVGNG